MLHKLFLGCIILSFIAAAAEATTITVGNHLLLPDTPGQAVQIFVTGGDAVSGLNLFAQVDDGGPELTNFGLPAGTDGPEISSVDLKTGTIFDGIPDGQTDTGSIPQVVNYFIAITAAGGSVPADDLLTTLTIDTTGFFGGSWDLLLSGVLPGLGPFDTDFAGTPVGEILNGSISIVPEPDALALLLLGLSAALLFYAKARVFDDRWRAIHGHE